MITLFIGRFQPFHNGHLHDIKQALKFSDKIIIAIGSSQESNTKENPFSLDERKEMIIKTLQKENLSNISIIPVPDTNEDSRWVEHVISILGKVDTVYTGNDWVKRLFKEKNYTVKDVSFLGNINATEIRNLMHKGQDWQSLVPHQVAEIIKRIDGVNRIKEINGVL
jgi:nicotinamide-nucleotide adenylyltransferase